MLSSIVSLLFSIGIAFLAFGAVYWPKQLGTLAASPGLLFIIASILFSLLLTSSRRQNYNNLKLKIVLLFPLLGSLFAIVFFGFNTLYISKFFSIWLLSILWISPLLLIDYLKIHHIKLAAFLGGLICLFGFIFSDLLKSLPAYINDFLFGAGYQEQRDGRPRGFSEEASQFSATISRFIIIYYLIWESKRRCNTYRLIFFLLGLALLLFILGSKGAVISIAVAVLSIALGLRQLPYLLLVLPMAWFISTTQLETIFIDIENFTSVATRFTLMVTGIVSSMVNPFGWGYYGFYGAIHYFGGLSLDFVSGLAPSLILIEARDIIENFHNVSTKSTLLDFTMVFGWSFLWLLVRITTLIQFNDPRVRSCFVYVIVSSFSTSGHLSVLGFLIFALIIKLYPSSFFTHKRY